MNEKGKKTYIAVIIILAAALAAAIAYIIAAGLPAGEKPNPDRPSAQNSAIPTEGDFGVETEYGFIPYPAQWKDYLKTDKRMDGQNLIVDFSTEADGNAIPLFTVTVGDIDEAPFGTLTDASGMVRTVYITVPDLPDLSSYDEETQNRTFAMQEGLNEMMTGMK